MNRCTATVEYIQRAIGLSAEMLPAAKIPGLLKKMKAQTAVVERAKELWVAEGKRIYQTHEPGALRALLAKLLGGGGEIEAEQQRKQEEERKRQGLKGRMGLEHVQGLRSLSSV